MPSQKDVYLKEQVDLCSILYGDTPNEKTTVYSLSYADKIKRITDVLGPSEDDIRALFSRALHDFYGYIDNGEPR